MNSQQANDNSKSLKDFLNEDLWPQGLQDTLQENLKKSPLRYFIIDNSGSMARRDGHEIERGIKEYNSTWCGWPCAKKSKEEKVTRWAELTESMKFHAELAHIAKAKTDFWFLFGKHNYRTSEKIGYSDYPCRRVEFASSTQRGNVEAPIEDREVDAASAPDQSLFGFSRFVPRMWGAPTSVPVVEATHPPKKTQIFQIGDKVVAFHGVKKKWLPGVIRHRQGDFYYAIEYDGEGRDIEFLPKDEVITRDGSKVIRVGDKVVAFHSKKQKLLPGIIRGQHGDYYEFEYDGEGRDIELLPKEKVTTRDGSQVIRVGDKAMAFHGKKQKWLPGVIRGQCGDNYKFEYDIDRDIERAHENDIILVIRDDVLGDIVEAYHVKKQEWLRGVIRNRKDYSVFTIEFDGDSDERDSAEVHDKDIITSDGIRGDKVVAYLEEQQEWLPGAILGQDGNGDYFAIKFDVDERNEERVSKNDTIANGDCYYAIEYDGEGRDIEILPKDEVITRDGSKVIRVGDKVVAFHSKKQKLLPGIIRGQHGDYYTQDKTKTRDREGDRDRDIELIEIVLKKNVITRDCRCSFCSLRRVIAILSKAPGGSSKLQKITEDVLNDIDSRRSITPSSRCAEIRPEDKVVCIIATDGQPSDGDIAISLKKYEMKNMKFVVRICTDDETVTNYWNKLLDTAKSDKDSRVKIDVIDDLSSEANEVHSANPWLRYSAPLHRLREFGISPLDDFKSDEDEDFKLEEPLPPKAVVEVVKAILGSDIGDGDFHEERESSILSPGRIYTATTRKFIAGVEKRNNGIYVMCPEQPNSSKSMINTYFGDCLFPRRAAKLNLTKEKSIDIQELKKVLPT